MTKDFSKNGHMVSLMENDLLFYLSSSFGRSVASGDADSVDCLHRIIDSRRRGLLLIFSSGGTLALILSYLRQTGDKRNAGIIESIAKKFRQKKDLLGGLSSFVVVSASASNVVRRRGRMIFMPVSKINSTNVLYPPIFLAENLTDCDLYANVISNGFSRGVPVSMANLKLFDRYESGGGNSTHYVYRRHKDRSLDLCFCVVDSDRKHPLSAPGDTAKFVMAVDGADQSPLCSHLVIDMYSAENLLPIDEIERQYATGKNEEQTKVFQVTRKIRGMSSWRHLPLKKGFKGRDLKMNNAVSNYWASELNKVGLAIPCCDAEECECIVVPSISEKTLANALDQKDKGWPALLNQETNQEVILDYKKIAIELKSWLCVGSPIRV